MKKIVLGLLCAMSFSFATTSEDNQKNVDETLKKLNTKIENLKNSYIVTIVKKRLNIGKKKQIKEM